MSGPSTLRTHPRRERLEVALLDGANILELSTEFGVSRDALYRRRRVLLAQQQAEREMQNSVSRLGVAERLAQVAAAARQARIEADEAGHGRLRLQALDVERKTLSDLLDVLPELDQAAQDREHEALLGSVADLLKTREDSALAADLARRLNAAGASEDLTSAVQRLADSLAKKEKS